MSIYLVTWNLNKEKLNYSAARRTLIALLEQYDSISDQMLESVRFVSTTQAPSQVYDHIKGALDTNDAVVISKMRSQEYWGILNPSTWDWISKRL